MKLPSREKNAVTNRGFTLVEVLIVTSMGSAFMLMSISLVHRVMRLESDFRQQANVNRVMSQLGTEFRRDVNRASEVDLEEAEGEVVFEMELPDEINIRYLVSEGQVLREEFAGDESRREQYPVPTGFQMILEELESPHRVVLTVVRAVPFEGVEPPVELRVEAVVGRRAEITRRVADE